MSARLPVAGDRVRLVGGFEDGLRGVVVVVTDGRYRVRTDAGDVLGGFGAHRVELDV